MRTSPARSDGIGGCSHAKRLGAVAAAQGDCLHIVILIWPGLGLNLSKLEAQTKTPRRRDLSLGSSQGSQLSSSIASMPWR